MKETCTVERNHCYNVENVVLTETLSTKLEKTFKLTKKLDRVLNSKDTNFPGTAILENMTK